MEAVVLEHRAGVASEREQHVVVELLEAAGAVGADHDALEVVVHVHGHRHERVDLVVGSGVPVARGVLADDRVAFHHALGEALRDRALAGVALEAAVADQVELAVAVPVALGQEQALLGARESDRHLEHELPEVAARPAAAIHVEHLLAQLARPLALGLARALGAQAQLALVRERGALLLCLVLEQARPLGHLAAALLLERGAHARAAALV